MNDQLIVETFFLKKLVRDLDDLVNFPEKYLVSFEKEPHVAKRIIAKNLKESNYGEGSIYNDGAINLVHNGTTVISITQWTDIGDFWGYILNLIEEYFEKNASQYYFPDAPVLMILKKHKSTKNVYFSVDDVKIFINEDLFIRKMLDEAEKFFLFLNESLGKGYSNQELKQTESLLNVLNSR